MKDKYDNIKLEDIDAEKLFKDIKDDLERALLHIDTLRAITNSDCVTLTLDEAFKKIDKAFDTITVIGNNSFTKLINRFQEEEEEDA